MARIYSNIIFGLALGSSLMLKACHLPVEWVGLAVFSVLVSVLLTQLSDTAGCAMWPRSIGLVGTAGFPLIWLFSGSGSAPGKLFTILSAILLAAAVLLAMTADGSQPISHPQGEENKYEI